jgi:hypothetical protein
VQLFAAFLSSHLDGSRRAKVEGGRAVSFQARVKRKRSKIRGSLRQAKRTVSQRRSQAIEIIMSAESLIS